MDRILKAVMIGDQEHAKYHPMRGFDDDFREILSSFSLDVTTDYDAFRRERLAGYDLLVAFVDRWTPLADAEAEGLLGFVAAGGGLLVVHNGVSLQARPELADLIGGRFTGHPAERTISYRPRPQWHVLGERSEPFSAWEEPYRMIPDERERPAVFLGYAEGDEGIAAGWAKTHGRGRVVCLSPGHHRETFRIPAYRQLLAASAAWLVGR